MALERDFHHPYQPYDIQLDFMEALYQCIQERKVGIFESPTGTGKSLSLICGSLTWLRDYQLGESQAGNDNEFDDEPEWVLEHARVQRRSDFLNKKKELEARLQKIRDKEAQQRKRYQTGEALPKRRKINDNSTGSRSTNGEEAEFLLDDYESDQELKKDREHAAIQDQVSSQSRDLAVKLGLDFGQSKDIETEPDDQIKIFFCSRTHSQLIQFANEIRRVKIPLAEIEANTSSESERLVEGIKHLALGSRKNLCINKDVRRLASTTAINERCLELQQAKTADKKCSFLPNKENETLVHQFRDHALAKIRDIEDLGVLGKKIGICPYYASRATIKPSEIVTLPYPLLLQRSAREAMNLSLKDHVVIIDEAHNLMDAIAGIYSVQISLHQLNKARAQLAAYLQKFRNRLKGRNRVYLAQTVRLIDSLALHLQAIKQQPNATADGMVNVSDLLTGKGADQINLYSLLRYLQESKLARKVDGYTAFAEDKNNTVERTTPVLTQCHGFFQTLTYPAAEGRFFFSQENDDVLLRYLLLDPANQFRDIIGEARAVILAGGTMSPMDDYKNHLFPYLEQSRIMTLSCGHVIPAENLTAISLATAKTGCELDFTFEKRSNPRVIDGLGETIIELCSVVPDGVVIFFPSYAYLEQVLTRWKQKQPNQPTILDRLEKRKPVIYESKNDASATDDVLDRYSSIINTPSSPGAILLSVVGGKLSEGINFSDKLGRGVLIVGLPFPNIQSAEWKAKLEYIEQQSLTQGGSAAEAKAAARTFYENACMRAVNQCIGRAIRHKGDYAAIFLLDRRYGAKRIQDKLPGWIQKDIVSDAASLPFAKVQDGVRRFFDGKAGTV